MLYGYMSNTIILCMRNTDDKCDGRRGIDIRNPIRKNEFVMAGTHLLLTKTDRSFFSFFCVFVGFQNAEVVEVMLKQQMETNTGANFKCQDSVTACEMYHRKLGCQLILVQVLCL